MRNAIFLAIVIGVAAAAQTSQSDSNMACAERLKIPAYPALANAARIQGTIAAAVRLSPQASIERITYKISPESSSKAEPMLTSAVESAIRESKFRTDCGGKTVILLFEFKREVEGAEEKHFFEPPNRFLILAKPIQIETNP